MVIFNSISIAINVALLYYSSNTLKPSDKFKKDLNNSVYHYQEQNWPLKIDEFQSNLNYIQLKFNNNWSFWSLGESKCCGYFNFTDYLINEKRLDKLPYSCMNADYGFTKLEVYKIGCLLSYEQKINFHKKMIYISSGLSISIQFISICLILYFFDTYQVILDNDKKMKLENVIWINPNKN